MNNPRRPNNYDPAALTNLAAVSLASAVVSGVFLPTVGTIVTGHIFTSVLSHR